MRPSIPQPKSAHVFIMRERLRRSSALFGMMNDMPGATAVVGAKRHRLGMLHLHVVERRDRARAIGKRGMRGNVAGARAADPDFRAELFQRREIVVARARAHLQMTSLSSGRRLRIRSAASAGAMYGGRAGPISIPVATDAVTLVVPRWPSVSSPPRGKHRLRRR